MSTVLPFVLAAMNSIAPARDHAELGNAIAVVVDDHRALIPGDDDKTQTAALLVAVAYRESTLSNDAIGDNGTSHCAFQINLPGTARTIEGWSGSDLRSDPSKCVGVAFRMLVQSARIDPRAPIAFYARGPRWKGDVAQRISRDRVALSRRIHADALVALAKETEQ